MPKQTPPTASQAPVPPRKVSGQEVYDSIMKLIEPDLTTSVINTLATKYANELDVDKKKRMEKYKRAFAEYQRQYKLYRQSRELSVRRFGQGLRVASEGRTLQKEQNTIHSLESAISNA